MSSIVFDFYFQSKVSQLFIPISFLKSLLKKKFLNVFIQRIDVLYILKYFYRKEVKHNV